LAVGSNCAKGKGLCPSGGCQMIIDTNSILIMGPKSKLDQMAVQYGGAYNSTLGMYNVSFHYYHFLKFRCY